MARLDDEISMNDNPLGLGVMTIEPDYYNSSMITTWQMVFNR
jgi:hypothetical protein